ncbi:MAG: hypothetical protein QXQ37_03015 [Nitrososphaerota archaeon]
MPIVLDDLLKTLSMAYIFTTYAHQPYVGMIYGKLAAILEDRIKDPGTIPEDIAMEQTKQSLETMKYLIEREKQQLREAGVDIDKILKELKRKGIR